MLTDCNKFAVEAQELQCPEYCFKLPFSSFQHPKYSSNIHQLTTVIKALSSSIGGVVILSKEPGQIDSAERANFSLFKARLEAWNISLGPNRTADMLEFVPLSEANTVWGLVLVKASSPTALSSPHSIDQLGFIVNSSASKEIAFNQESNTASSTSNTDFAPATPRDKKSETDSSSVSSTQEPTHGMTDVDIDWQLGNKIAWTTHKKNWHGNIVVDECISVESCVQKCATSSFAPRDPIALFPRHLLETILGEECNRNKVMEAISAKLDSPRAFALVSPSWLNQIGIEELCTRPKNHIVDILVVTEMGSIYLWTIVHKSDANDNLQRTYMVIAGRQTKFLLLKGQATKSDLRVDCYLYNLQDNTVEEPALQKNTQSFFINNVNLERILENLGETIVARETYLRNVT